MSEFAWDFNLEADPLYYSDEDFYALANGYCKPEQILNSQIQIDAIHAAVAMLSHFFDCARQLELIAEV